MDWKKSYYILIVMMITLLMHVLYINAMLLFKTLGLQHARLFE